MNVAVLADYATGQKKLIENLRSSEVLERDAVVTLNEATGKAEADVEDLFEVELFAELVNATYELSDEHKITVESLLAADATTERLVLKTEAHFRLLPETVPMFDHYSPSEWLLSHPEFLTVEKSGVEATIARAEALFVRVNALLRST